LAGIPSTKSEVAEVPEVAEVVVAGTDVVVEAAGDAVPVVATVVGVPSSPPQPKATSQIRRPRISTSVPG